MRQFLLAVCVCLLAPGCAGWPEKLHQPQYHNPFPQLGRVAVLPFFNQSGESTLNGLGVANAYRNELQQIPGFEVMPIGVVHQILVGNSIKLEHPIDFQQLAKQLNVDAVIVGSITDFSEYYPPRMGLAVNWYAANPCFHPIPPGYGLPWGTAEEEFIPGSLVLEAEFALAREQMKTQTPIPPKADVRLMPSDNLLRPNEAEPLPEVEQTSSLADSSDAHSSVQSMVIQDGFDASEVSNDPSTLSNPNLPPDWPDPRGFVPPQPQPVRPKCHPHQGPIIELVRQYHGNDTKFTEQLRNYYSFRNDDRAGGWRSYLQRKDDFIQFCCHLHITEMLAARGGASETRVVLRTKDGRYDQ